MVGIAIYEGKVQSIEDDVIEYFPRIQQYESEWSKLKIKHVLSKMTGIIWPGPTERLPENKKLIEYMIET